jgi:hypothetical protein
MKERLIQETIIYKYINRTKLSDSRRATYYEQGKTIPKKYQDKTKYHFKEKASKIVIFDIETNQPVIKNTKTVGTERTIPIKGNNFYSGFSHNSIRIAVVESIKGDFLKCFNKINKFDLTDYPIEVEFIYFDQLNVKTTGKIGKKKVQSQDIDNLRFAYEKCSLDLLTRLGKIVDDKLTFIRKISSEFIPVENIEDRQLYIRFYKYKPGYSFNNVTKKIEEL